MCVVIIIIMCLIIGDARAHEDLRLPVYTPWVYQDFDTSMQCKKFKHIIERDTTNRLIGMSGTTLLALFKTVYEQLNFMKIQPRFDVRIPKIIHQIWIGDCVPKELELFRKSWIVKHPHWQYYLWTQENISQLHLHNKALIEQAKNPAEYADLLRYEILYQYGGVYVDMDFECLQPLDILHHAFDLYVGIQPLDTGLVQLGIGIVGAIPKHPIIKRCIETIQDNYNNKNLTNTLTAKTGPIHFTKQFVLHSDKSTINDIALPADYFYPLGSTQVVLKKKEWLQQGAFGIHHWAKTWNEPCYRRPQFRSIKSWGELC